MAVLGKCDGVAGVRPVVYRCLGFFSYNTIILWLAAWIPAWDKSSIPVEREVRFVVNLMASACCLSASHTTVYGYRPCFSEMFWVTLWQAEVWVNRLQAARTVGEQRIPCISLLSQGVRICRDGIRRKSAHGRRYPCESFGLLYTRRWGMWDNLWVGERRIVGGIAPLYLPWLFWSVVQLQVCQAYRYCPQDYYTSRMGVMLGHVSILT